MKKDPRIESKVQKALDSLDNLDRVPANPWLYTRIQARLDALDRQAPAQAPTWQWALVAALLAFNAWYVYSVAQPSRNGKAALERSLSEQFGATPTRYSYDVY